MRYKYLLWDIDGTILNFLAAERNAIKALFIRFRLGECTDEMVDIYSAINVQYWQALERGEIQKKQMLVERFREFFVSIKVDPQVAETFNEAYQIALGDTIVFNDNAPELLEELKQKYVLIAVTNGTKTAQSNKLDRSGLCRLFDYVFISEDVGAEKPDKAFFDYVFEHAGIRDKSEAVIIGDSITSDIQGGVRSGIDTCWYNPHHDDNRLNMPVTYEIESLPEVLRFL